MYYTEQNTYYNIKTKDFEDYATDQEELAEIIAMHEKDGEIYCVDVGTETIERETEQPDPSLSAYERNR